MRAQLKNKKGGTAENVNEISLEGDDGLWATCDTEMLDLQRISDVVMDELVSRRASGNEGGVRHNFNLQWQF